MVVVKRRRWRQKEKKKKKEEEEEKKKKKKRKRKKRRRRRQKGKQKRSTDIRCWSRARPREVTPRKCGGRGGTERTHYCCGERRREGRGPLGKR